MSWCHFVSSSFFFRGPPASYARPTMSETLVVSQIRKKNHASIQMFGTRTSEIALRVAYTADLRSLWRLVCLWSSVCPKRVTEPTLPLRFVALLKIAVSLSVHRVLRRKPCMHCLSAVEKLGICRFRRYKIMLVDASMYPKNHWKGHILCLAPL